MYTYQHDDDKHKHEPFKALCVSPLKVGPVVGSELTHGPLNLAPKRQAVTTLEDIHRDDTYTYIMICSISTK